MYQSKAIIYFGSAYKIVYDHQYVREILKETDCAYLRRNTYRYKV